MPAIRVRDRVVELPEGEPIAGALPPGAVAARVDGALVDVSFVPAGDVDATPVAPEDEDGLHVLRHSTGYALAARGMDTRRLQHYLGHASITNTVRYTAMSPEPFKDIWR